MTRKNNKPARPYGGSNARERRETRREAFIEAGLEVFGTTGYIRSTIKDICQTAGLTERYFYESFQNKEDLLVAVYRKLIADIESEAKIIFERTKDSPEDMGYKILKMFYRRLKDDPRRARVQIYEILGVSARVDREYQSAMLTLADWTKLIMFTIFPELQKKSRETTIIFTGFAGAVMQIANRWVLEGLEISLDEIVRQSFDMFLILGKYYYDREVV
jgi:AcrR family transcriptional regulator